MDSLVLERPAVVEQQAGRGFWRRVGALLALCLFSRESLDLEMMPDHLKRDLGFLDGPDPRYEDELLP
jgi:hypothetical protein